MAVLLAAIVSTFGAGRANADAIYTYTGNDFTTVTPSPSVYTTSDFVSITLRLNEPLADNLNLVSIILAVVDFTVSDGFFSYDLAEFPATLLANQCDGRHYQLGDSAPGRPVGLRFLNTDLRHTRNTNI
jgi:hypothetical protein